MFKLYEANHVNEEVYFEDVNVLNETYSFWTVSSWLNALNISYSGP